MNKIKVSNKTIEYFRDIVTGDSRKTEYLSGSRLVDFFNYFGFDDEYGQGFPSRWFYAENKLKDLNRDGRIREVIEYYYSPINFIGQEDLFLKLVEELNKYLYFDNLSIDIIGKKCVFSVSQVEINVKTIKKIDHDFIQENILKCDNKIKEGDYSGAITSARSLVETVLLYIRFKTV